MEGARGFIATAVSSALVSPAIPSSMSRGLVDQTRKMLTRTVGRGINLGNTRSDVRLGDYEMFTLRNRVFVGLEMKTFTAAKTDYSFRTSTGKLAKLLGERVNIGRFIPLLDPTVIPELGRLQTRFDGFIEIKSK